MHIKVLFWNNFLYDRLSVFYLYTNLLHIYIQGYVEISQAKKMVWKEKVEESFM